jgi:uncharacterized protein YciI
MVVVSLTYKVPLEEVDRHGQAHVEWLRRCYDGDLLLASGRKAARVGGLILARGSVADAKSLCENDPFFVHGVADYEFTEVEVVYTARGLDALKC